MISETGENAFAARNINWGGNLKNDKHKHATILEWNHRQMLEPAVNPNILLSVSSASPSPAPSDFSQLSTATIRPLQHQGFMVMDALPEVEETAENALDLRLMDPQYFESIPS